MNTTPNQESAEANTETVKPGIPEVSLLEDERLTKPAARMSTTPLEGGRFHRRYLRNMRGAFLTVLNADGKILFIAGGALRLKVDDETDRVVIMTPSDIARGLTGEGSDNGKAYQPVYRELILKGEDRAGDHTIVFDEVPYLSLSLGAWLPGAYGWAVLTTGPAPDKAWIGSVPNGKNTEEFLHHRNWITDEAAGGVKGAGGNDLSARLAPEALAYAGRIPSAWGLAVTSTALFGGMTTNIPPVDPLSRSPLLRQIMIDEKANRTTKLRRSEEYRRKNIDRNRPPSKVQREIVAGLDSIANIIEPGSVAALDKLKVEVSEEPIVSATPLSPEEAANPTGAIYRKHIGAKKGRRETPTAVRRTKRSKGETGAPKDEAATVAESSPESAT